MSSGPGSLPSGTVTFLFTDVEGSTRLLKQLGDGYADVLEEHQRILRDAFATHGGHEVDTQGDSFFVTFDRARSAVAAAVDAQRGLAEHEWPEGVAVRVRMGLHSGEPIVRRDSYTGMGVHRAARISAAGHGGQVLISNATRELVRDDLPPGVRLRDLGKVKLKDLDEPERIHQLFVDGLANEFPALRTEQPPVYRRPRALVAGLVAVLAAVAAVVLATGGGGGIAVRPNSVAEIDPGSGNVIAQIPVGNVPTDLAFGSGSLWVINSDDKTVSRIDVAAKRVVKSIPIPERPTSLAAAGGAIWVSAPRPGEQVAVVRKIDPQFNTVGDPIRIGSVVPGAYASVRAGGGQLWVAAQFGLLARLDPSTGRFGTKIDPKTSSADIAVTPGAIWLAGADSNTVTRVDTSGVIQPISVGHRPVAVAIGEGGVWASDFLDDSVVRIDPGLNAVKGTTKVGAGPGALAIGAGSVWVTNSQGQSISRIDPHTGRVVQTIPVGGSPNGILFAKGKLWVSVSPSERPPPVASAGTLRVTTQDDYGPFDPALSYNLGGWSVLHATCAMLLNYPDKPATSGGAELVPEVATSLPSVSKDGRTYTFTIRPGFRFSPPSNEPVTARTFANVLDRDLSPKTAGPANFLYGDIAGAAAFNSGKARHLSGVVVRGDRLIIHLVARAPNFAARIAMPFACAVPLDTPYQKEPVANIPMAGPYYFAPGVAPPTTVLARNPNYHGSRPRGFARIQITPNESQAKAAAMVESGKSDWPLDGIDRQTYENAKARYRPRSSGPLRPQLFTNPQLEVTYVILNFTRPLFADVRLRQAVNFAFDRRALAALPSRDSPIPQAPTDQYLPPGMPGFRDVKIYPFSPDLATARKLAGTRHRHAILYTCSQPECDAPAQVMKSNLAAIGIDVEVRAFDSQELFARIGRKGEPYDLAEVAWIADWPDPDDFLDLVLLHGASSNGTPPFEPPYTDPRYAPQLRAAAQLSGPARLLAYGRLDAEIAKNSAPWAALSSTSSADLFSARIGCQVYNPLYGMDLVALCVRKPPPQ